MTAHKGKTCGLGKDMKSRIEELHPQNKSHILCGNGKTSLFGLRFLKFIKFILILIFIFRPCVLYSITLTLSKEELLRQLHSKIANESSYSHPFYWKDGNSQEILKEYSAVQIIFYDKNNNELASIFSQDITIDGSAIYGISTSFSENKQFVEIDSIEYAIINDHADKNKKFLLVGACASLTILAGLAFYYVMHFMSW